MIVSFEPLIEEVGGERLDLFRRQLAQTEGVCQKFVLAADAAAANVFPAQLTTVDVLVMTADGGITYVLNGADTAITLDANGIVVLWGSAITALTLSEPNSATVNVKIWAWGV